MIFTWRLAFEDTAAGRPADAMIVRAPTAEDALTMFTVNYGERADRLVEQITVFEVDALVGHDGWCLICGRPFGEGHTVRCRFKRGWMLESSLDEDERQKFGLDGNPGNP